MLSADVHRLTLAVLLPKPFDSTSLLRGIGPLSRMTKRESRFNVTFPRGAGGRWEMTWDWMATANACFLQRPHIPDFVTCAEDAKLMGLPLWIDWDDDVAVVRRSNPVYATYPSDGVLKVMRALLSIADVVTVATEELKRRLIDRLATGGTPGNPVDIQVIPNACHWRLDEPDAPRQRVVSWRGSAHHFEDLVPVIPTLGAVAASSQYSGWKWHFLGDVPWPLFDTIPEEKLVTRPYTTPFRYMRLLRSLGSWFHIVPLNDNAFNGVKSNLAWMEATAAGAVTLAPAWGEWLKPGIINYRDGDDFGAKLRVIMDQYDPSISTPHPKVSESREYILQHLTLDHLNRQRWNIVNRLWEIAQ